MAGHNARPIVLTVLMMGSDMALAERYEVVEDRFGSLGAELVEKTAPVSGAPQAQAPLPISPPELPVSPESESAAVSASEREARRTVKQEDASQKQVNADSKAVADGAQTDAAQVSKTRELSVFERVYLETEVDKPEEAERLRRRWESGERVDVTAVDESQFVDGDALLERRGVSDGTPPYQVTYDSQGQARVTFLDAEKISQTLDEKAKERVYTSATEYKAAVDEARAGFLAQADAKALNILGIETKSYFERYASSCCGTLPHARIPVLEPGRAHFFKLTKDDRPFRFEDGESRYLLLKLPSSRQNYPLRVRSFIRKFDKQQIDHGVFLPQLVLLNQDKELVRIIAEPLLQFEAENWVKYGYLEGVFQIDQHIDDRLDERYLVVNTTFADLSRVTQVEVEGEPIDIEHMPTGSFEIEILVDDE